MDFFYHAQIRRYLVQFIRIFSELKHETDADENGVKSQKSIPVVYGDPSWQVAQILKGQSQNTMLPVPMMAAWISNLEQVAERRKDPTFTSKVQGVERKMENGEYTDDPGNRFTIDRYMPVPYKLTMQLDIWTSNTNTKLQILEQIFTLFNPSLQLQQSTNPYDWTSLFEVELVNTTWTNRSIGSQGAEDRDVASLQFELDIWINPPAKIKKQAIIKQIITNVTAVTDFDDASISSELSNPLGALDKLSSSIIVTPGDFRVALGTINGYADNELVLLDKEGNISEKYTWESLLLSHGEIIDDITRVRLKLGSIDSDKLDVLGTVRVHPEHLNVLYFDIDVSTLPSTTIPTVTRTIDPASDVVGESLPEAAVGQRYIILNNNIASGTSWGALEAYANDVIEYTSDNEWVVVFSADDNLNNIHYAVTLSQDYLSFNGNEWEYTYLAEYAPGYWRIENINPVSINDL